MRAILVGLEIAWAMNARKIIVESDCKNAVDGIVDASTTHLHFDVITRIRSLLARDWDIDVRTIWREANAVADKFVRARSLMIPSQLIGVPTEPAPYAVPAPHLLGVTQLLFRVPTKFPAPCALSKAAIAPDFLGSSQLQYGFVGARSLMIPCGKSQLFGHASRAYCTTTPPAYWRYDINGDILTFYIGDFTMVEVNWIVLQSPVGPHTFTDSESYLDHVNGRSCRQGKGKHQCRCCGCWFDTAHWSTAAHNCHYQWLLMRVQEKQKIPDIPTNIDMSKAVEAVYKFAREIYKERIKLIGFLETNEDRFKECLRRKEFAVEVKTIKTDEKGNKTTDQEYITG